MGSASLWSCKPCWASESPTVCCAQSRTPDSWASTRRIDDGREVTTCRQGIRRAGPEGGPGAENGTGPGGSPSPEKEAETEASEKGMISTPSVVVRLVCHCPKLGTNGRASVPVRDSRLGSVKTENRVRVTPGFSRKPFFLESAFN